MKEKKKSSWHANWIFKLLFQVSFQLCKWLLWTQTMGHPHTLLRARLSYILPIVSLLNYSKVEISRNHLIHQWEPHSGLYVDPLPHHSKLIPNCTMRRKTDC